MGISEDTYTHWTAEGGDIHRHQVIHIIGAKKKAGSENERQLGSDLKPLGNSRFEFTFPMLIQFVPL